MVNTNWFDAREIPNFPYKMPCTDIFGYAVNDGKVISEYSKKDLQAGEALDAFVVLQPAGPGTPFELRILSNDQLQEMGRAGRMAQVRYAVAGFITGRNGIPLFSSAKGNKPESSGARSALGLSKDGQTMSIVVVQSGPLASGINAERLARYMIERMGASDVINMDNSGSSQFIYTRSETSEIVISRPGDRDQNNKPAYRPVPSVLIVSVGEGDGTCSGDGTCTLMPEAHDELKRSVDAALDRFDHIGQFYSNDAPLFDNAASPTKGLLEDCAELCLNNSQCSGFTYAYGSLSAEQGRFCTLFRANTVFLPAKADYQFYRRK